jgi:hypothetical protein
MTDEEKMIDILQSFVDLGKISSIKEDLKYDIEATEWAIKKINELKTERDYYKQRYLEFNNVFTEAMLKDLGKRYEVYRTCLHCGEGQPNYCERCYQELIVENLKLQRK